MPKITALYSRLSKDDERLGESLSIENQRAILEDYAKKQGFNNLVHYIDDGWSDTDFSRPDWKRMIADIEADKSSGRREQTVDFYFNFIGKIELPIQDEAEPFDPDEHSKAQFRSYYYRNREKILAEKAEQRAAEKAARLAAMPTKTSEEIAAEEEARREKKRAYQREYQREWQRKRKAEQVGA
jgi:hypothetical protein